VPEKPSKGYNPYKRYSIISETLFVSTAISCGYDVSLPCDSESLYDAILDNGSKLFRVQIKTVVDRQVYGTSQVALMRNKSRMELYPEGSIDFFAVHLFKQNIWYLIPFSKVAGRTRIVLHGNADSGYGKYKEYLDNWGMFTEPS
jgi:hypothetical protein